MFFVRSITTRTPISCFSLRHIPYIMGRRRKKHSGQGKRQERGSGYTDIVKENKSFENYYKEQGIVPAEEWESFISALKRPLPATFRITGFRGEAKQLLDFVKGNYIDNMTTTTADGQTIQKPVPLPWYPDQAAWQLNYDRQILRKVPALQKLHQFLVSETDSGNISRQELVSMIPPLLLDVKSNHAVLDMCAAPGSKTAQLIEALHADESSVQAEGVVIGNDSDNKRCYIMVHQAKRLNSPNCMVVNHDARFFPKIFLSRPDGKKEQLMYDRILCDVPCRINIRSCRVFSRDAKFCHEILLNRPDGKKERRIYDRILCDVRCSGDGTLRKNIAIWKQWAQTSALSLHNLQRQILKRGTELLDVGGKLVYSTCSFNPIENEAVVASVLNASEGALQLADVGDLLPGLKRRAGMSTWKVINETPQEYASIEDVPEKKKRRFLESMWPPTQEEAAKLNLERCVRIVPHDQDSGGFFVAVIEKSKRLPFEKEPLVKAVKPAQTVKGNVETTTSHNTKKMAEMDTTDITASDVTIATDTEITTTMETDNMTGDVAIATASEGSTKCAEMDDDPCGPSDVAAEVSTGPKGTGDTEEVAKADGDSNIGPARADGSDKGDASEPPQKKCRVDRAQYNNSFKEDPFVYFDGKESVWPDIQKFYKISEDFPVKQLLTRSFVGKKRNLYFTSKKVKEIIHANQDKLKVINSGIKTLIRSESDTVDCSFRLSQEGITSLFPYIRARKVLVDRSDMVNLLSTECPFDSSFSRSMQEQVQNIGQGSLVFVCDPDIKDVSETTSKSLIIVGWKGKMSVRSYLDRNSREHYLRMFGVELPKKVEKPAVEALRIEASGDDAKQSSQTESETEQKDADATEEKKDDGRTIIEEGQEPSADDVKTDTPEDQSKQ